ncbi:hypothetical protein D4R87_02625 [bacterium]|nr:MAG: hypothetical protein D4R87_02625 [bacterium]
MQQSIIEQLKAKLEAEKKEIKVTLGNVAVKDPDIEGNYDAKHPNFGNEEGDNIQERAEYEENIASEQQLEVSLMRVENALKRIEDGTYGKCLKCGGEISEERLMAFPSAENCIECEKLQK